MKLRILHVDDSISDMELISLQLTRQSDKISVDGALSPREAFEMLSHRTYDCILSDYQMGEVDGIEFLRDMRRRRIRIPFIFLTGQGNEEVAAEAFRSGADDYFMKDAGFAFADRLINGIKKVVSCYRQSEMKTRAEEELRQSRERLQRIHKITSFIKESMSLEQLVGLILNELSDSFPTYRVAHSVIDENNLLTVVDSREPDGMPQIRGSAIDMSIAPAYLETLKRGEAIIVEDVAGDSRIAPFRDVLMKGNTKALLDIPVQYSDNVTGLLCLDSSVPWKWTEHEIITLTEICELLTIALKDARHYRLMRQVKTA